MMRNYILAGITLALCVCGLFIIADDSIAGGSGTLDDPYDSLSINTSDIGSPSGAYHNAEIYVYVGSSITITMNVQLCQVSDVTPNHGISIANASASGTLTGDDGNTVIVTVTPQSSTLTMICVSSTHTATWNNWDGSQITTTTFNHHTAPIYMGATPTRPSTAQYEYTFDGWSPTPSVADGDVTYTAQYTESLRSYTVTWENWDGTVLETDTNVPYGTTPTFDGATPTRPSTAQYEYTFDGWNPSVGPVTGDIQYTAVYSMLWEYSLVGNTATILYYLGSGGANVDIIIPSVITFNGTDYPVRSVGTVGHVVPYTISARNLVIPDTVYTIGVDAFSYCRFTGTLTIGSAVTDIGMYAFSGCSGFTGTLDLPTSLRYIEDYAFTSCRGFTGDLAIPSVRSVGEDAFGGCFGFNGNLIISWDTRIAQDSFEGCTSLHFPVQFRNYNDTLLQEKYVLYGQIPAYSGTAPIRPMDEDYEYVFSGWTPVPSTIQTPMRYTAEFTPLFRYIVIWTNWDDSILLTDRWTEGRTPVYSGITPAKPSDIRYDYEFAYWNPTPAPITGNMTYKANFTAVPIVYDFGDWQYTLDENYNAVITHYIERTGVLQIPTIADGHTVRSFMGGAMTQASGIVIPKGIVNISYNAFSGSGISEVLNLSNISISGNSYGLNNATVYTSVPGWMYIDDTTYTEKIPDTSPTSGLIRIIPILIIIGIVVHILRNRVGNGDE